MTENWSVETDQSVKNSATYPYVAEGSAFRASDFQLATITLTSNNGVTSGAATMKHKMGLVEVVPVSKTVTKTRTVTYTALNNFTINNSGSNDGEVTASSAFTGNKPYTNSSKYFYVVVSRTASTNTAVNFTCSTTEKDWWDTKSSGSDIGYGQYKNLSVLSARDCQNIIVKFPYIGNVQSYSLPWYGTYQLLVWGAQGGSHATQSANPMIGAPGGYSYGNITQSRNSTMYVCVGQIGVTTNEENIRYAYNGGGKGGLGGGGGGGATHIATTNYGELVNYESHQQDVLIVAGGGGGADTSNGWTWVRPGYGGGLIGGDGIVLVEGVEKSYKGSAYKGDNEHTLVYDDSFGITGGTQTMGGLSVRPDWAGYNSYDTKEEATFGKGGWGKLNTDHGGGGGGGWYGGGGGIACGCGAGGSGYVGGVTSCETRGGNQSFLTPDAIATGGTTTETGHTGDGYAIIRSYPQE